MNGFIALCITLFLLLLDLIVILVTYIFKYRHMRVHKRREHIRGRLYDEIRTEKINLETLEPEQLLEIVITLQGELTLPEEKQEYITSLLLNSHLSSYYCRRLKSRSYLRRVDAAFHLKFLPSRENQEQLLAALVKEKNAIVILHISNTLAFQHVTKAIKPIVRKLATMNRWYAQRIQAILITYRKDLLRFLSYRLDHSRLYMQRLICAFALSYPSDLLLPSLIQLAQGKNKEIKRDALKALLTHYPQELIKPEFSGAGDFLTLTYVIQAYGKLPRVEHIQSILSYSRKKKLHPFMVHALSEIGFYESEILDAILDLFMRARRKVDRELLAQVLANRADYYLARILSPIHDQVTALIQELASLKHLSAVLDFINRNHDQVIEQEIMRILKKIVSKSALLNAQMVRYLRPEVLNRHGIRPRGSKKDVAAPHSEPPQRLKLAIILTLVIILTPIALFFTEFSSLIGMSWNRIGRLYVVRFNYLLMFYSLTINSIYLILTAISFRAGRIQARLSAVKDSQLLYTPGVLPSVSIIAPAFNEAANIIESTNSLLNQHYPDFELIIVNDGSKDDTLTTLIDYFELEKQDMLVNHQLKTRPMRGIYKNRDIPNLIVIDKENGGKADSLNLGLNIGSREFFCGIDADSLLEPDSLKRAISVMIDSPHESIAAGGNIFPVNGCTVSHGHLEKVTLPGKFLARLQSLEYIRAFMTGRLGWAHLNSLLIISGAFGIFDRELTIKTGGYLTKSGRFHRDTVGEDMELVVRISRYMREKKKPYSVDYAFDANCWTEVPESMKVLHRQRDRWHRGLIDIMLFHRKLIGNPRYGRLGMLGMLYYFLFEFIGPFIEAQGLILVAVSALIGVLNPTIALLLFSTTILLGILVSVSSVMIAEFNHEVYSPRDVARLLLMGVIENFGVRQLISFWRVQGFFSAMKTKRGWGAQTRKGFKKESS